MFRPLRPFNRSSIGFVPPTPGVYIIYQEGDPFYVGRSRVSIFERLWKHVNGLGSRRIKVALDQGIALTFEYQEMMSVEQAEALLIREMGVFKFGNLRRESDPADWA